MLVSEEKDKGSGNHVKWEIGVETEEKYYYFNASRKIFEQLLYGRESELILCILRANRKQWEIIIRI